MSFDSWHHVFLQSENAFELAGITMYFRLLCKCNGFLEILLLLGTIQQEPFGLYIQAFCIGLDQVLDSYRKCLIDLEKQVVVYLLFQVESLLNKPNMEVCNNTTKHLMSQEFVRREP